MYRWLTALTSLCIVLSVEALVRVTGELVDDSQNLINAENVELIDFDTPTVFFQDSEIPIAVVFPVAIAQDPPERPFLDYTRVIKKILYGTIGFLVGIIVIVVLVATI